MLFVDGESPGNRGKSNLSGVDLLDETVDGTVVHKVTGDCVDDPLVASCYT